MPATGKITLDASDYKKTLEEVKSKTVNASAEMSKAVKQFGGDVGKVGGVVSSLSSEVGSSFGQIGKVIGAVASGPVAILTAAFGALLAAGVKMWDQLTTSVEEYQAKMETQISIQEKAISEMSKRETEENSYMERLNELAKKEHLSNEEKTEAAFLLNTLSGRYKTFSAEIDEATGKITGLAEAEKKLNEEQRNQRITALQNAIESETTVSNAAFKNFAELPAWLKYTRGWLTGENADAEEAYEAYSSMSTHGKREMALEMLNPETGATTKEEISFWKEELARLDKIMEKEAELNNLRKIGTGTVKERATELEKESKKVEAIETELENFFNDVDALAAQNEENAEKARQKEEEAERKAEEQRKAREAEEERRAEEAARRDLEALKREQNARAKEQQSFRSMALKAVGLGSRAAREEAILAAEQKNGGPLDSEQYGKAVRFANAKFRFENFQFNAPQDFAPRVNSLVARGGSDAPVSMPKIEDLQSQTLNNVKTIKEIAREFLSAAKDWGTI